VALCTHSVLSALAACIRSTAHACLHAQVLEDRSEAVWQQVRRSDDPSVRRRASYAFGASMPSAGWANALALAVGGNGAILGALDGCMLGQVRAC